MSGGWRFEQSQGILRNVANKLLLNVLNGKSIKWLDNMPDGSVHPLDQYFDIDAILVNLSGMIQTIQAKFLSSQYSVFDTVTIEYMNDPANGIEGDWFHCAAQFYFVGYATPDERGFQKWIILNWATMADETGQGNIHWREPRQNAHDGAKANFKYVYYRNIPKKAIIAEEGSWGDGMRGRKHYE